MMLLNCPACGCDGHTYHEYTCLTNTRCDDHHRQYQCGADCGFSGPSVLLNCHDWDEARARVAAGEAWNEAVTDARSARADRYRNGVPTQGTIPLGSLVETETGACLIVVAHYPDCDGSLLYALSHTPTPLMFTSPYEHGKVRECLRRLLVLGYTGEGLTVVEGPERVYTWLADNGYYKEGQWVESPFGGYNTNGERNEGDR